MDRLSLNIYAAICGPVFGFSLATIVLASAVWLSNTPGLLAAETITPERAKQIFEVAEPAVVQLTVRGRLDGTYKPTNYGTGFAVRTQIGDGIVTAGHVIGKDAEWDNVAGYPDRDIWIRTVVNFGTIELDPVNDAKSHPDYDVAEVFVGSGDTHLALSETPSLAGDQVLVISWRFDPNARRQGPPRSRVATVLDSEKDGLMRLAGDFHVSESGSPVLNHMGEVVGVLVERRIEESGSAVQSKFYASWVKETGPDYHLMARRTENPKELAGRCIFLGKRSALATGKPEDMPFGRDVLRRISSRAVNDNFAGTTVSASTNVAIRSGCPLVQPDGVAFYGSVIGSLRPGKRALIKSVNSLEYLNDTFYWAVVDKIADN